jgi:tetratricopeptide (TPR) repeat protein
MRISPSLLVAIVLAVSLTGAALETPALAQQESAESAALLAEGERLASRGEFAEAIGYFEAALVADPRNAAAYAGLGRIAVDQSLPGTAIGYFREALTLSPDSRAALEGQGRAYLARGAVNRARANLARIQSLCGADDCPEARDLAARINESGARTALRASEVAPNPVVEVAPPSSN